MVHYQDKLKQNNAERATGAAVKAVSFDMGGETGLADGDIITLGALPLQSITTDLKIIVGTEFNGTTPQFVVGQYNRQTGAFVPVTATVVLDGSGQALFRVPLISADFPNLNADGTAYTGDPSIVNDDATALAVQWTGGATAPTAGECTLVFHHDYYGTTTAKYGCDNVPLSVYAK